MYLFKILRIVGIDIHGMSGCGAFEFIGPGQCAALARGTNMALGWATGISKADANQKAVSQCIAYSGVGCVALLAECN